MSGSLQHLLLQRIRHCWMAEERLLNGQKFDRTKVILSDTRTTYYVQSCGLPGLYLPDIQVALISEQTLMQIRLANVVGIW